MNNIYFSFINKWDYIYIKDNGEAKLKKSLFYNFMKYTNFNKAVIFYNQSLINQLEITDEEFEITISDFISKENIEIEIVKISDDNNSDSFFEEIYDNYKKYIYDKDSKVYFNGKTGSPTLREVFNFIASFNSNTKVIDYNKPRDEKIEKKNRFSKKNDNHTDSSFLYKLKVQNSYNYTELFKQALETGNVNEAKKIFDTYNLFGGDSIIKESLDFLIENQFLDDSKNFKLEYISKDESKNELNFREKINILYNKYLTNDKKEITDNSIEIMSNIINPCTFYNTYKLKNIVVPNAESFYRNIFENYGKKFDQKSNLKDIYGNIELSSEDMKAASLVRIRHSSNHGVTKDNRNHIQYMKFHVKRLIGNFNQIPGELCINHYDRIEEQINTYNIFESYNQATDIDNDDIIDLVGFAGYNDPYNGRDGSEGSLLNIYNTLKNNDVKIENVYLIVTNGIYKGICLEDEVKDKSILELFKESFNDSYVHIIPFDDNMIANKNIDENLCYDTEDNDDFSDKSILFNRIYDFIMKIKSNNKIVLSGSSGAPDLQNVMKIIPSLVDNTYCYYRKIDGKGNVENEPREEVIAEYIKVFDYNNVYINARYKNMLNQAIKDRDIVTIKLILDILKINKKDSTLDKILKKTYKIYNGSFSKEFDNYDLSFEIERYKLRYLHIKAYNDNHNNKIDYSNCVRGIQPLYQKLFETQILNYSDKAKNIENPTDIDIKFSNIVKGKKYFKLDGKDINLVTVYENQISYDNLLRLIVNEENQFSDKMITSLRDILYLRNTIVHQSGMINYLRRIYNPNSNDDSIVYKIVCDNVDEVLIDMYNIQNIDNPNKVDIENELKEYIDAIESCKNILDM